jgi:hypothetical protein
MTRSIANEDCQAAFFSSWAIGAGLRGVQLFPTTRKLASTIRKIRVFEFPSLSSKSQSHKNFPLKSDDIPLYGHF